MTAHPKDFYVAHCIFAGDAFPRGPKWGGLTDGPADFDELHDRIVDHFDTAPTLNTLRVWHFPAGLSPRDVTEDVIAAMSDCWPEEDLGRYYMRDLAERADRDYAADMRGAA